MNHHDWRLVRGCGVSVLVLAMIPVAQAQEAAQSDAQQPDRQGSVEPSADQAGVTDIVVTATRKSESLSKVSISISAFDTEDMQKLGVKAIDDLVRLTPGLALTRGPTGSNQVAIRGISSAAGAGVTGIYIDDTPTQVRNLGYGSGNAFPEIFDLERVEVLRGPQGTLFGAGSEGGTVRFIQTAPNMRRWSVYARSELAGTYKGAATYEAGLALGGPIIEDKVGFRASVYYRRNGGYVDAVDGTFTAAIEPATGRPPAPIFPNGNLIDFTKTGTFEKDANSSDALTARAAAEFRPADWLTITPSLSYQKLTSNDGTDEFWTGTSNIGKSDFTRVEFSAGDPSTNPALIVTSVPQRRSPRRDRFYLGAVSISADLGSAQLISNSSYFDRKSEAWLDFTLTDSIQFAGLPAPAPGYRSGSLYEVGQKNFVEEIRLQSSDGGARLRWVIGAFYSNNRQTANQGIYNNFVTNLPFLPSFGGAANSNPFGPGSTAIENSLGVPQLPGGGSFSENDLVKERQYAGFAQLDFRVVDKLTITAGARLSRNELAYDGIFRGPLNNENAPFGRPCPAGQTCTVGAPGPFAPIYQDTIGFQKKETSFTPKIGLSYQATPRDLFYATVSKGFRPAGINAKVPSSFCARDLTTAGYSNAAGANLQPISYNSDSVWSYEIGAKNRLWGGRLSIDANAYLIKWSNIQNQVFLPTCLYAFVDNLGDATSKGLDLAVNVEPARGLQLGVTVGYNDAYYDEPVTTLGNVVLFQKGSAISASRPWTVTATGEYAWNEFYVRADGSYFSQARPLGQTDPGSPIYSRFVRPDEAYGLLNLRGGIRIGDADASLFVQNATNAKPLFGVSSLVGGNVYRATTLRPRTVGITLSFRR